MVFRLHIASTLLTATVGKSSKVEVEVENTTKHDIALPCRTVLGRLQPIQPVPVEVKRKTGGTVEIVSPKPDEEGSVSNDSDELTTNLPKHFNPSRFGRFRQQTKKDC